MYAESRYFQTAPESVADVGGVEGIHGASASRKGEREGGARASSSRVPAETEREYTDASNKLKFNKRTPVEAGGSGTQIAGSGHGKRDKKKARLANLEKANTKLLSFGDDEDG